MKRYRERIHDLEARVASERETFAQAVEDYAAAARTRMRDRAVSPGSLLAVAGVGFVVGQVLKRRPPTIKKSTETKTGFRWSGLLAGAAMSAARLASSNPGALVQIMQRIRSARQAPGPGGRMHRGYPVEEHV